MKPVPTIQSSSLRTPNRSEHARFEKDGRSGSIVVALIPLIFLIPIIATPRDPEVPKFIALLIGMELGMIALFRVANSWHRTAEIYFDFRCTNCTRQQSWKLGSPRYGLDKRGAMRCRCGCVHRYERVNFRTVQIKQQPTDSWLKKAVLPMVPQAWDAEA